MVLDDSQKNITFRTDIGYHYYDSTCPYCYSRVVMNEDQWPNREGKPDVVCPFCHGKYKIEYALTV
jgi:hypothetical protein